MKAGNVFLAGLGATSVMTLFSYIVSEATGKQFTESELLAALIDDALPKDEKHLARPAGWATHYAVGLGFAMTYKLALQIAKAKPNVANGLAFGAVSGLAGILSWKLFFKSHPAPPKIDFKNFYRQLLPAHLVYGAVLALLTTQKA